MQLMRINTAIYLFPLFCVMVKKPLRKTSTQFSNSKFNFEMRKNKKILKREFTIGSSVVNSEEQLICPHPRVNHLMASWMILLKINK